LRSPCLYKKHGRAVWGEQLEEEEDTLTRTPPYPPKATEHTTHSASTRVRSAPPPEGRENLTDAPAGLTRYLNNYTCYVYIHTYITHIHIYIYIYI